jgi:hypothetical protein
VSLADLVQITISSDSNSVTREGFGVPLIVGASNRFPERFRSYSSLSAMEDDDFVATDAEYRAALRLLSSNVRPPQFLIGNAANRPTMRWKVTPIAGNLKKYQLYVGDGATPAEFTSDGTGTVAEIVAGLKTAVDDLATGATTTDNTTHLTITASGAGVFLRCVTGDRALLLIEQDHADPGIAADLTAMLEAARATEGAADFYAIILCFPSTATIAAAAAWTEVNRRLLVVATANTDVTTAATTDVASTLKTAAYTRSPVIYHHDPSLFADAGWAGRCLPLTPGSETWAMKTIVGLTPTALKDSEVTNLKSKNVNRYQRVKGRNLTLGGGIVPAKEYIDTVRGIDELEARLGEDVVIAQADRDDKIPYDDGGISMMKGIVQNRLNLSVGRLLTADPPPLALAPSSAEVDTAQKADRLLPITFTGTKAGAIHTLTIVGRLA